MNISSTINWLLHRSTAKFKFLTPDLVSLFLCELDGSTNMHGKHPITFQRLVAGGMVLPNSRSTHWPPPPLDLLLLPPPPLLSFITHLPFVGLIRLHPVWGYWGENFRERCERGEAFQDSKATQSIWPQNLLKQIVVIKSGSVAVPRITTLSCSINLKVKMLKLLDDTHSGRQAFNLSTSLCCYSCWPVFLKNVDRDSNFTNFLLPVWFGRTYWSAQITDLNPSNKGCEPSLVTKHQSETSQRTHCTKNYHHGLNRQNTEKKPVCTCTYV